MDQVFHVERFTQTLHHALTPQQKKSENFGPKKAPKGWIQKGKKKAQLSPGF